MKIGDPRLLLVNRFGHPGFGHPSFGHPGFGHFGFDHLHFAHPNLDLKYRFDRLKIASRSK